MFKMFKQVWPFDYKTFHSSKQKDDVQSLHYINEFHEMVFGVGKLWGTAGELSRQKMLYTFYGIMVGVFIL